MARLTGKSYWFLGMDKWADLALGIPSIPLGTPISLLMGWSNDGAVSVQGHIDLTVIKPDGSQLVVPVVANQDKVAPPGSGYLVQFSPIALEQLGGYRTDVSLGVQVVATGLWDGVIWLVNGSDAPSDWALHFDFFAASQLVGSIDKTWQMGPNSRFAPYTWQVLGTFPIPLGVDRIDITATDKGRTLESYDETTEAIISHWYPSSSIFLFFHKPPGKDPLQEGLNVTGRIYLSESGRYTVILGQTL